MSLAAAALVLAWTAGAAASKPAPVRVYLEPVDAGVVQGLAVDKVEDGLRDRLARLKGIELVTEADEAMVVLRVTEALGWSEKRRLHEAGDRPVAGPTGGGGIARGNEGAYGVRTQTRPQVSLVVRATWPGSFADLQSATDERQLKGAVDSVASQLTAIVRRGLTPR